MLPLYEGKMIHHFDHRFGTYEGQSETQANQGKLPELDHVAHADPGRVTLPRYWVPEDEVAARLDDIWDRHWMLGWRDVSGAEKIRTVIACIIPRAAVNHKLPLMMPSHDPQLVAVHAAFHLGRRPAVRRHLLVPLRGPVLPRRRGQAG